jgi:hypothetical protein
MGNICFARLFNNFIICATTSAIFSNTLMIPLYSYEAQAQHMDVNLNDIALIIRLEKLYSKVKRHIDKLEHEKLINLMFDIKKEVEGFIGQKIDIDSPIDTIEKEAKKHGAKFQKNEIKQIKKDLKNKDKKHSHKVMFLDDCHRYNIEFNQLECNLHFENQYLSKDPKGHGKEDNKEVKVPIRVSIGVTASLCGYFLSFIPHPVVQGVSKFLIATGLGLCVDGTVKRIEENEQNQNQ